MLKWLFGKKEADSWTADKIDNIVNAYGTHLETHNGVIEDEGALPFKKGDIKRAILLAISFEKEQQMLDSLKEGYLRLSNFQPLSDSERRAVGQRNNILSMPSNPNTLLETAKIISDSDAIYQSLLARSMAETHTLQKELHTLLGSWGIA